MPTLHRLLSTRAPAATVLIRLLVGWVFLSEGILKFLLPGELGAGRFAHIGIPSPEVMGPFVGAVEIIAGALVLIGLLTRPAAPALWINITTALVSTKLPILLGHAFWLFSLPRLPHYGFWSMAHEARTDLSMWLACLFLLLQGPGRLSLDALLTRPTRP
ncbi:MAG: DoxX family protein [Planctomycetota bacterium]|nr:DoxX family protein [Planctomycetota bacterium]